MAKHFLYLRGEPGSGKITVARLLQEQLGWRLFWIHDLDNIARLVGDHRVPRLMDAVSGAVIKHLLASGQDIIYVRPSRERRTVELVHDLAAQAGYKFTLVSLCASYDTLLKRVCQRPDTEGNAFRIKTKARLDEYLTDRPLTEIDGDLVIDTDLRTPAEVAELIKTWACTA